MLSFLRRRPEAPEAAEPAADGDVVAEVPARPCPTCGAALTDDQDWCHECGAAQPGRIGERPGWRAAATVAGLTLALVGGAGVASYAAITQDPAPPPATQAQVPPGGAPAPVTPTTPATPTTPTTPAAPTPDPTADDPRPYDLPPGAVEVYDPDDRDLATLGAPGLAADGDDRTGFEVVLPPDGRPAGVGLLIDLDAPRDVTSINVETSTPGFDVEVYGAEKGVPRRITSEGWQHIADAAAVDTSERIPLGAAEGKIRRIVVWITKVPAADRRAVIGEVVVRVRPS